jgi:plasmid stabilization system protein ParE
VGFQPEDRLSVPFITPAARRDIRSIWRYIAQDSVRHADLVEEAILTTCYSTAELPGIGHQRPDLTERKILFVPVRNYERYVIAYAAESAPLRILRVLHGARDVPRLFR